VDIVNNSESTDQTNCSGPSGREELREESRNEPSGLFSGRPWQAEADVSDELVARIRRDFPLDIQVSDCLLKVLAARGITESDELEEYFYPSLDRKSVV